MKQKTQKLRGEAGFDEYYEGIFKDRWKTLKQALLTEHKGEEYYVPNAEKPYFLDSASILAALCLPVKDADRILDLCAAPGGKTLVTASRMNEEAELFSNERSPVRKQRLMSVVKECLPDSIQKRVRVSCGDGSLWCKRQSECFDRILLDAPCSSERHVLNNKKYLEEWSLSRIKTMTREQWALLSSAYRLLSPNGIMVYSTCALSPLENDGMMERLVKKFNADGDSITFLRPEASKEEIEPFCKAVLPSFEQCEYGITVLPDRQGGAGPMYISVLRKEKSIQKEHYAPSPNR